MAKFLEIGCPKKGGPGARMVSNLGGSSMGMFHDSSTYVVDGC